MIRYDIIIIDTLNHEYIRKYKKIEDITEAITLSQFLMNNKQIHEIVCIVPCQSDSLWIKEHYQLSNEQVAKLHRKYEDN